MAILILIQGRLESLKEVVLSFTSYGKLNKRIIFSKNKKLKNKIYKI